MTQPCAFTNFCSGSVYSKQLHEISITKQNKTITKQLQTISIKTQLMKIENKTNVFLNGLLT